MASNRHLGRIVILQSLFEHDFRNEVDPSYDLNEVITRNIAQYEKSLDDTEFVEEVIKSVIKKQKELDDILGPLAPEWPVDQIARIDKLILRIALYELRFGKNAPPKVIINEAVELAKEFGGDNSSKFVNGVLGSAYREMDEGADAQIKEKRKEIKEDSPEKKEIKPKVKAAKK